MTLLDAQIWGYVPDWRPGTRTAARRQPVWSMLVISIRGVTPLGHTIALEVLTCGPLWGWV